MESFAKKCRRHNLKLTPQRAAVYKLLMGSNKHPSADSVHQEVKNQFPSMSLDTVNRTLLTFAQIGIIEVVEGQGDPRRYDPNLKPHQHFHCTRCREIFDLEYDPFSQIKLPEELNRQFQIETVRVVFQGLCASCQKTPAGVSK